MSMPLLWNRNGLAIDTCFTPGFGRDDLLLARAGQLERTRTWHERRPPTGDAG